MSGAFDAQTSELDGLFARARDGDDAAWEQLVDQCYDKVRRVVGRRLDRRLRTVFDSTDFTNAVFMSLVAKSNRFEFKTIQELRGFLMEAAKQKVIDEFRRQHRQKRDIDRQQPIAGGHGDDDFGYELPGSDPTPSQVAQGHEARELILAPLDAVTQQVVHLKEMNYSNQEIAGETGLHLRKVQRLLKHASDSWRALTGRMSS